MKDVNKLEELKNELLSSSEWGPQLQRLLREAFHLEAEPLHPHRFEYATSLIPDNWYLKRLGFDNSDKCWTCELGRKNVPGEVAVHHSKDATLAVFSAVVDVFIFEYRERYRRYA